MKLLIVTLMGPIIFGFGPLALAQSFERSASGVFVPNRSIQAAKPSEVTGFSPEWCAKNLEQNSAVTMMCYGRLQLVSERSVRAFVFTLDSNSRRIYFEAKPSAVELRDLSFDVIGSPVSNSAGSSAGSRIGGGGEGPAAEPGRASLAIDNRGEVVGVKILTSKLGRIVAFRPGSATAH